jgi:beta-lactamase class A
MSEGAVPDEAGTRRARRRRALAFVLVAALLPSCARAQHPAAPALGGTQPARGAAARVDFRTDTAALRRTLDSLAAAHHGVVGYAVRNLETGERLAVRGDETFPTASLIKVAILVTLFDLVEKGRLSLDDPLTVLKIDQVPGSGVLQFMHPGMAITVRDAAWLMTTLSDNTATNLILDKIAIRRVWEKMDSLGLHHTKVHSKVFLRLASVAPDSSAKYGLGVTTPNEMARLFELLGEGRAVSPRADSAMVDILAQNTDYDLLQRYAGGVRAAHKTGMVDSVRTECSLWFLPARVVGCVLTKDNADTRWVLDSEPQLTMARMGEAIVNAWRRREDLTSRH